MTSETITLEIEIAAEPLAGRRCHRCQSQHFRALLCTLDTYTASCADCGYHGHRGGCGRIVSFTIKGTGTEEIVRCGDKLKTSLCTWDSASAEPLAICMGCKRLVQLQ